MPITNALVVRWANGYKTGTDAASVASYGRREGFLSLATLEEESAATGSVSQTLAQQAALQRSVVLGIEPQSDTDTPYLGVWVRDQVTAPDQNGSATGYRVVAITTQVDDEGWATFVPELETTSDTVADRTKTWLKRIGDGTFAGRSTKATLVRPLDAQVLEGKVEVISPPVFSQATLEVTESPRWQPEKTFRLTQVDATLLTPGTSTTTVVVKKNGSTVLTLTLGSGIYHVVSLPTTISYTQSDYMTVATTGIGSGAADLSVQMIGGPAY